MAAEAAESIHVAVLSGMIQGESSDAKEKPSSEHRKEFNFWTDQEVWLLLDAYEEKWNQLDRGNVKSKHWEEISARLSTANLHTGGAWAAKTPTQCKNKIEDMKKKFRAEKVVKTTPQSMYSSSKWVFFQRMDSMLRNHSGGLRGMPGGMDNGEPVMENMDSFGNCGHLVHEGGEEVDTSFSTPQQHQQQQQHQSQHQVHGRRENLTGLLMRDEVNNQHHQPGLKRRRGGGGEVVAVVKAFGESLLRIEEAQVQMQREVVRMNAEAELRRIEMEVKRTEMMLNTQLQIAKLFAGKVAGVGRRKKVVRKAENAAAHGLQENEDE